MLYGVDKRLKVICSLFMLAAIALTPLAGMSDLQAQEDDTFHPGPLNPDFVKFWKEATEPFCGYIPPPMDLSHLDGIPTGGLLKSGALPASFNWTDQGKVTSVKNQNPCGTCWIFGTTSVLESAVLIGEDAGYDFSEQSVALCVDRSWVYLYDDSDEPCGISHGGGWSSLASEVFIKKGAVLESCNPYNTRGLNCDGACACDNCTPVKIVNGYRYVTDDQSQTSLIKDVVYNQGPVTMAFYYDENYKHPDATYGTVYDCDGCLAANHMVSIIGWDDSVPHFKTPGTGAWLVKNSWGTAWGNSGYFWLAYNSSSMEEIAYLEYKDYDPNEKLYYWDEAGIVADGGYEDTSAWMANIFTSTQDGSLTHVDFWTTSNDAQYDIYVYLDGNISDGFDDLATSQSGTCQEFGYYSIPLTSPVSLTSGQPFTIAVNMTTPGYNYPIPVEVVIVGFVEPTIQGEVSYARHGDTDAWEDLAPPGFNACLRARVRSEAELSILTTHLSDGVVGKAYEEIMEATGGIPPYTWAIIEGALPGGLELDTGTGVISGTPIEDSDFTVTVNVTDDAASSDSMDLALKIYPPLEINTTALPDGELGEAYTATLEATGGKTPYTWNATGLPDGLNCSAVGVISGTPTEDGDFTVTVNVTDSFDPANTDGTDLALKVYPALEITTTALPDGELGEAYTATLEATGGKTPYTWNATGLPDGLNCSAGGAISGIPTEDGDFTVTVNVTDSFDPANTDGTDLALKIYLPLEITTIELPDGELGEAYTAILEATGGKTPYTWDATGLPPGLTCSAAGVISGAPVGEVGSFNVTVTVTSALGNTDEEVPNLTISYKLGDANMDGMVDAGDITKVKRIYFGLDPPTPSADANGDEMIDTGDITAIKIIYFS
jgi:C1A family cysteine protease